MEQLDAIIIGTGQAGKPLAGALAEAKWHTTIIERDRVGGTCVVRGCTPTKTMLASARVAHLARAIETDETRGFMKAVVDADTDEILGAAVLGVEGGEVATVIQMAMM